MSWAPPPRGTSRPPPLFFFPSSIFIPPAVFEFKIILISWVSCASFLSTVCTWARSGWAREGLRAQTLRERKEFTWFVLKPGVVSSKAHSGSSFSPCSADLIGQIERGKLSFENLLMGLLGPSSPHCTSPRRGYSEPGTQGCPGPRHPGVRPGPHPSSSSLQAFLYRRRCSNSKLYSFLGFLALPSSSPSPAHSGMLKGLELQRFRSLILSSKGLSLGISCQLKLS